MKVVETYDWTRIETLKLAIYSAKEAKEYFDGDEEIIDDCIDAAEEILNEYEEGREPSVKLLGAARSAARSAESLIASPAVRSAWSAALSAWSPARSAARSAVWSARSAKTASWSAIRSAWPAARSAESSAKQDIHEHCLEIVVED